jgi:HD-like signal output (HDOD) protein
MPVLNNVAMELNNMSGSEDADANRLAEVILKDPNLTSHVLKVANSVQYNYSKATINTVSRAVVLIGLKVCAQYVYRCWCWNPC